MFIWVLGYDLNQAENFCDKAGLSREDAIFVRAASDLRGTRKSPIILVDGWTDRMDREEIQLMLRNRELICLVETEWEGL